MILTTMFLFAASVLGANTTVIEGIEFVNFRTFTKAAGCKDPLCLEVCVL
jgi:hypothetical protein